MPDIFCPLLEDGKPVVRPPKKGEYAQSSLGTIFRLTVEDSDYICTIYRRLSADEYAVVRKDDLERLVESVKKACDFAVSDYVPNGLFDRLRSALAPFVKEKTYG